MDILGLPDIFLRKLMRTMEMKDRMRLRLTCRAFEKLVAKSNAGYFKTGMIMPAPERSRPGKISMHFDEEKLQNIDGHKKCLQLRNRLLRGATFGRFTFILTDAEFTLDFLREFTQNFNVSELRLYVESRRQFENAVQLMADFSNCEHHLRIAGFLPDAEQLLDLSSVEKLKISSKRLFSDDDDDETAWEISPILFFDLLDNQLNLSLDNVRLEGNDLKTAMEIISDDERDRCVRLSVTPATVVRWLKGYGFTENSEEGDICEDIKLIHKTAEYSGSWQLCYLNSSINLNPFLWSGGTQLSVVRITNKQEQ